MFSYILMERKGKARDQQFFQLEGQIGGVAHDATRSLLGVVERGSIARGSTACRKAKHMIYYRFRRAKYLRYYTTRGPSL